MKINIVVAAATLAAIALSATAVQASLVGDSVQVTEYFPNLSTSLGTTAPQTVTVGGITFVDPGTSAVTITVTGSTITLAGDYTPDSAAFNGFDIQDLNLSTIITGATLDGASGPLPGGDLTFDSHNVFVNLAGVALSSQTPILIDLTTGGHGVPEPATWAMMLVGFGGLGAAMRARRKQVAVAA